MLPVGELKVIRFDSIKSIQIVKYKKHRCWSYLQSQYICSPTTVFQNLNSFSVPIHSSTIFAMPTHLRSLTVLAISTYLGAIKFVFHNVFLRCDVYTRGGFIVWQVARSTRFSRSRHVGEKKCSCLSWVIQSSVLLWHVSSNHNIWFSSLLQRKCPWK